MDDGKVTVTIEVDAELLAQVTELLRPYGMTPEDLVVKFFEYCVDPKTKIKQSNISKNGKRSSCPRAR